jgi:hypothetical protein
MLVYEQKTNIRSITSTTRERGRAMAATAAKTEDNSERKRISIPKADESSLAWWDEQKDPGLSVRLLIRNEIERNGFSDTAFRPVAQLPRRGRPPGIAGDIGEEETDASTAEGREPYYDEAPVAPVAQPVAQPAPVAQLVPPVVQPAPVAKAVPAAQAAPVVPAARVLETVPPTRAVPAASSSGGNALDDLMNG